jgi:hypothetical protein
MVYINLAEAFVSGILSNYFDTPRPLPSINLENVQATTRDLATLLGIALPGVLQSYGLITPSTYNPFAGTTNRFKVTRFGIGILILVTFRLSLV